MKIDKLTGPGSTPARRKFWNAAANAVTALQKQAGKNVSVMESQGKGTIINVDRKIGATGCALPSDMTCPHAVCFAVKMDAEDTSDGDFMEVRSGDTVLLGIWFDGTDWQLYTWDNSANVAATDPFDTWHSFAFQLKGEITGIITCDWFIDGVAQTPITVTGGGASPSKYIANNFFFGSNQQTGGAAHRTLKKIAVRSNPATAEEDFSFPPDSFDFLTTGAVVSGDELRIDATDANCYAEKDFEPEYDLVCVPKTGCKCIRTLTVSIMAEVSVTHGVDGDGNPCDFFVHKEETIYHQFGVDLCAVVGSKDFVYPGFDNGQITSGFFIAIGGADPPPIIVQFDICSVFFTNGCGAGFICYSDDSDIFTVCDPPGSIVREFTTDLGSGDYSKMSITFTFE